MSEESVFNLIQPVIPEKDRDARHKSKYPGNAFPTASTFGLKGTSRPGISNLGGEMSHPDVGAAHTIKKDRAGFGSSVRESVSPDRFVQKTQKSLPQPSRFSYADGDARKPAIPKRDEAPVMGLVTSKNFVVQNAVDNILAVPRKPKDGDANFLTKSDYGQVPKYLQKIKGEIQAEYDMIRTLQEDQQRAEAEKTRLMTEEERAALLAGLKRQWEGVNRQYQTLSFTLDTPAKRERKENLEKELEELEKNMQKLSKKHIVVVDDPKDKPIHQEPVSAPLRSKASQSSVKLSHGLPAALSAKSLSNKEHLEKEMDSIEKDMDRLQKRYILVADDS